MFRCLDKLKNTSLSEFSFHLIKLLIQANLSLSSALLIYPVLDSGPCIYISGSLRLTKPQEILVQIILWKTEINLTVLSLLFRKDSNYQSSVTGFYNYTISSLILAETFSYCYFHSF